MFEMVASIQLICSTADSIGSVSQEITAGSTFTAQSITAARQAWIRYESEHLLEKERVHTAQTPLTLSHAF